MNGRYLKATLLALVMTLFVACPIYASDEVNADSIIDAQSKAATIELQQGADNDLLVAEAQGADDDLLVAEAQGAGDEDFGENPEDEIVPAEPVTADQIEIVDDYWGLNSIQNEDQSSYCYFYAKFRKAGDDHVYYLYFTGFKYNGPSNPYPTNGFIQLIKDMGAAFLNGQTFDIYDGNAFQAKYGFVFDPIDAEKSSLDKTTAGSTSSPNYPEGDYDLCWAATASNLIQFTSWTNAANEDVLFSIFREKISDYTGSAASGVKWFFNGVNSFQAVDSNGNVVYSSYSSERNPQQREVGTGNYINNTAAENIIQAYSLDYYPYYAAMIKLMEALNNKNGVGLSIGFYDGDNKRQGGHAITCFGYIYDISDEVVRALFTTDSDDSAPTQGSLEPTERLNILTMHPFVDTQFTNGLPTVALVGYSGSKLDGVSIMTSYPNRPAVTETEGTKDISENCDIIIEDIYMVEAATGNIIVMDSTEGEDAVNIIIQLKNQSYAKVNNGNGAYVLVRVNLYRGATLLETFDRWIYFEPGKDCNPLGVIKFYVNKTTYIIPAYAAEAEEYYRLTGEILSIVDYNDEKTPIIEAYTSNNKLAWEPLIPCYVDGKGAPDDDYDDDEDDDEIAVVDNAAGVNTGDQNELALYAILLMMAILSILARSAGSAGSARSCSR